MRVPTNQHPEPPIPEWEIYEGMNFLYLVGPGPDAMVRCGSIPPTLRELDIARRAMLLLIPQREAGVEEILGALVECGYGEGEL